MSHGRSSRARPSNKRRTALKKSRFDITAKSVLALSPPSTSTSSASFAQHSYSVLE